MYYVIKILVFGNMKENLENYYYFVCSDSSKEGAEDLFIQTVNNDGFEKYKSGRFLYLNAWRNISGKYVHTQEC